MYNFITASKDASVYSSQPYQNAGLDQILEISKTYYSGVKSISRALLKFDIGKLSDSITNGSASLTEAILIMKDVSSNEIPLEYTLFVNAVSQSWEMGIGTHFDEISTSGVTWKSRDGESSLKWLPTDVYAPYSTGSYAGYGGVWYSNYEANQSYSYSTADVNMDVTSIITAWSDNTIPNDGMLLRYSMEFENNNVDYGIIQLFSKETHTIYQPKLRIGWDDQTFLTGSLSAIISDDIKVSVKELKPYYKQGSTAKFRINGRQLYPLKTFTNQFPYADINYLPKTTYYQIKDVITDDIIIPFSEYSKVSCDANGNYVEIDFSNWQTVRKYKIEFKIELNGSTQYFDNNIIFGIEN